VGDRVVITVRGALVSFFFQAEDGIRDPLVTGVQTCALPILGLAGLPSSSWQPQSADDLPKWYRKIFAPSAEAALRSTEVDCPDRSEERRVGKEWRSGGEALL